MTKLMDVAERVQIDTDADTDDGITELGNGADDRPTALAEPPVRRPVALCQPKGHPVSTLRGRA